MASDHAHEIEHDYHLVDPSPWPAVGSLSVLIMMVGAVFAMKPDSTLFGIPGSSFGTYAFGIGFLGLIYTVIEWWRDVVKEAEGGDHTPVVRIGLRYGMILFIASEVMFFVAWFWAFFGAWFYPIMPTPDFTQFWDVIFADAPWPPEGVEVFDPWHLPFMNTLILLLSGTTVTWAHHAIEYGDRDSVKKGLWLTVGLGALFTCLQGYEYAHAAFGFGGDIYSSAFYMATGFHGFHVIIGTIFLAVCLGRTYSGHFKADHHFGFEAAAWYWHFVDVVWLFLFICIYILGASPIS